MISLFISNLRENYRTATFTFSKKPQRDMLKTKIIAADLQNLTDARYFAAWLVDYISFDLSDSTANLPKVKEIMDWVEGPIFSVHYSGLEDRQSMELQLEALAIDHLILGPYANEDILNSDWQIFQTIILDDEIGELTSDCTYIVQSNKQFNHFSEEKMKTLINMCNAHSIYLDCGFTSADVDEILNIGVTGLVLRGGEEEKVGVKSYEDLDEILEALED